MTSCFDALLKARPNLAALLDRDGQKSIASYAETISQQPPPYSAKLARVLYEETGGALPSSDAFMLHTADHMGIINHPFFWTIKPYVSSPVVVLATSNMSPYNSSFPRGIQWTDHQGSPCSAKFIHAQWHQSSMYQIPAIGRDEWIRFIDQLPSKARRAFLKILEQKSFFEHETQLSSQLTSFSNEWWSVLFPRGPKLVYIELEKIVCRLLLDELDRSNSAVYQILFNPEIRRSYVDTMLGIQGAHSASLNHGTHFFWLTKSTIRSKLKLVGDTLVSEKNEIVQLDPATITTMIRKRELLPTLALCYQILVCIHGAALTGSFSQTDYLPRMINAWHDTIGPTKDVRLDIFAGAMSPIHLSMTQRPAMLMDLFLHTKNDEQFAERIEAAGTVRLSDAIQAISYELHTIIEPSHTCARTTPAKGIVHI